MADSVHEGERNLLDHGISRGKLRRTRRRRKGNRKRKRIRILFRSMSLGKLNLIMSSKTPDVL